MTPEQFKQARKKRGYNQREAAAFLKASYSALTKWETGVNPIPEWAADKIRSSSGKFVLENLTNDEITALNKLAASKGVSPEAMIAGLVRAGLKFGGLAFLALHLCLSPFEWSAKSMMASASAAIAYLK